MLVEGCWSTGAGLTADQVVALLRPHTSAQRVQVLDDPALWGRAVTDERFAVVAETSRADPTRA